MHKDFSEWYSTTSFGHDRETLPLRWKGVEAALEEISVATAMELVQTVYKWPLKPSELLVSFQQHFKDADEMFLSSGNDKEVQVLAGCVLAMLCVDDEHAMPEAALAVLTASACGSLDQKTSIDLVGMAKNRILIDGANARKRPANKDFTNHTMKKGFDTAVAALAESLTIENAAETFKSMGAHITSLCNSIQSEFKLHLTIMTNTITIQDEELQTLWWVIGKRSGVWDAKFDDISASTRPLLLGYEYSKLTTAQSVEPPSLQAVLTQVGIDGNEVTIPDAVNTCGVEILRQLLSTDTIICPTIFPIHDAIRRALETEAEASWIPVWGKVSGIEAEGKYSSLDLAIQFYRELKLQELLAE